MKAAEFVRQIKDTLIIDGEVETHYFKEIYKITYNSGKFSKERI